jgi:CHAT domain-containing protein/tetratricopeptide (TPR) repeat protein
VVRRRSWFGDENLAPAAGPPGTPVGPAIVRPSPGSTASDLVADIAALAGSCGRCDISGSRPMAALVPLLAAAALVIAGTIPAAGQAQSSSPADLAARVLTASEQERSALLSRKEYATVDVASALLARGAEERLAGQFVRSFAAYDAAVAVAKRAGADRELGQALNGLADTLFRLGNRRAMAVAEESVALHERLNDTAGLAEAWNNVGNVKSLGGLEAIPAYEKSLELWTAANDRLGIARALNNLGNVYRGADDGKALEYLTRARSMLEDLGDERRAGVVIGTIAVLHFNRGEYPDALELVRTSLAIQEKFGDAHLLARALDMMGNIFVAQGAYGRALAYFHRSLKLRLGVSARFDAAESWNNIGMAHAGQGDYELAVASYREALRLNRSVGAKWLVAEALLNLGNAAAELGQRQRAEANYRQSLTISESLVGLTSQSIAGSALRGLANVARARGRIEEARAHLARALALHESANDRRGTAEALSELAVIDLDAQNAAGALARAQRVTEIAQAIDAQELVWQGRTLMGRAHRRLGHRDAARRELNAAIDAIDTLRQNLLPGRRGRAGFLEGRLEPFHELLALSIEEGADTRALELAERAKARALADVLQQGRSDISRQMTADERREERRLRGVLVGLNQRIQSERLQATPDRARIERLEAERAARRLDLEAFEARLYSAHPELRIQRGAATPFTLAEAPQILPTSSTAVLQYVVARDRVYLFVLTRGAAAPELQAHVLPGSPRSLAAMARRFRDRVAARDLTFVYDARRLYDLLVTPAERALAGKTHVVVVPDGPLWDLPFQALRDPRQRYWIESVAVSYAPSLTVLRETRRRSSSGAARTLLAMGKAQFGSRVADPAVQLMSDLGPLPDAERQVRLIGGVYGPERSATYLGADAREDRFKSEAPRFSILHLASHGVLDETSPFYSHIVLSPGADGSSEDGLLEAWELLDLKLDAELVVLSACETGRGRVAAGEGTVGTMWALFVAGSRAAVVSQWKVEATSTTALMTEFHRGLAAGEGAKAALLRRATLAVLKDPQYAHPFYWAPFVLVGNPD